MGCCAGGPDSDKLTDIPESATMTAEVDNIVPPFSLSNSGVICNKSRLSNSYVFVPNSENSWQHQSVVEGKSKQELEKSSHEKYAHQNLTVCINSAANVPPVVFEPKTTPEKEYPVLKIGQGADVENEDKMSPIISGAQVSKLNNDTPEDFRSILNIIRPEEVTDTSANVSTSLVFLSSDDTKDPPIEGERNCDFELKGEYLLRWKRIQELLMENEESRFSRCRRESVPNWKSTKLRNKINDAEIKPSITVLTRSNTFTLDSSETSNSIVALSNIPDAPHATYHKLVEKVKEQEDKNLESDKNKKPGENIANMAVSRLAILA